MKAEKTTKDYLIASRNIPSWLASLSAAATNTSGYMFIGLIGYTYKAGLSSIWVTIGWICGDYFIWRSVYKKLRTESEEAEVSTVPSFLAGRPGQESRLITIVAGILTLVILAAYASAQLTAGSKALHVLFKWNYSVGAIIGAIIVVLYCLAGGIRASIWTDAAQAIVMIISMSFLLGSAMLTVGSPVALFAELKAIDANLVALFPENLQFGIVLFILGWFFAGIGVIGQPHMAIRIMTIKSVEAMKTARRAYFGWYIPFSITAVGVGLYSRVILPNVKAFDPELALPLMAKELMPEIFVGLILAGLFAATMSTADSQVLSSSAALTQDIFPDFGKNRLRTKAGTVIIVFIALCIAVFLPGNKSVFTLVVLAWSLLGASIGPVMILRSLGVNLSGLAGSSMMISGAAATILWRFFLGYHTSIYDILPGIAAAVLVFFVFKIYEAIKGTSINEQA